MAKSQITAELASLSLAIGTPTQTSMDLSVKSHAIPGMFMNLPIHEIDFFDKNPRRHHDAEQYAQIKASIRVSGIQQPVHVTQRPGEERYVLAQGGNTRLKIMRELYEETGDDCYRIMPCFYQSFTTDADLQIAHLIENEQRAEMCFWDKACAYGALRDVFQADVDKKLSLRELEALFTSHGLSVSHQAVSTFMFAVENLVSLGNKAFGLSNAKVAELKKLHSSLFSGVKERAADTDFDTFWQDALQNWECTGADSAWDLNELLAHLQSAYEKQFGTVKIIKKNGDESKSSMQRVITGSKKAKDAEATPLFREDKSDADKAEETDSDTGNSVRPSAASAAASGSISHTTAPPTTPSGTVLKEVNPPSTPQHIENCASKLQGLDRTQLTKTLQGLVKRWLGLVSIADCFRTHPAFRYGFYVEYPAFEHIQSKPGIYYIIDNLHPEAGNVFTFLAKLSGQEEFFYDIESGNKNPLLSLPENSKLKIAYQDPDKLDEYNNFGIGDRSNLITRVLAWQSDSADPFATLLDEIIAVLRQLSGGKHETH